MAAIKAEMRKYASKRTGLGGLLPNEGPGVEGRSRVSTVIDLIVFYLSSVLRTV